MDERNQDDQSSTIEQGGDRPEHEGADEVGLGLRVEESEEESDKGDEPDEEEAREEEEPIVP